MRPLPYPAPVFGHIIDFILRVLDACEPALWHLLPPVNFRETANPPLLERLEDIWDDLVHWFYTFLGSREI